MHPQPLTALRSPPANGFTLLEVVVALTVLSFGLLGGAAAMSVAYRMVNNGVRFTKAAALAAERLEILQATVCQGLANGAEVRGPYRVVWTAVPAGGTWLATVLVSGPGQGRGPAATVTRIMGCWP